MDDTQNPVNRSLRFQLSLWLSGTIVVVAIVAGTFSFLSALNEADELQDNILRQVAALLDRYPIAISGPQPAIPVTTEEAENHVFVQSLGTGADAMGDGPKLPDSLPDGLQTLSIDDDAYRVYVTTLSSGHRFVVGQETAVRDEIARDGAFRTLMPFLILVPILVLLASDIIRKMFRPLTTLARRLNHKQDYDLSALTGTSLPQEVQPFVVAINRLLERVALSVTMQRRFIANAAHELRTPLTALSLQAERLSDTPLDDIAGARVAKLRGGISRTRNLLDQLLTFTRLQEVSEEDSQASLRNAIEASLEELLPVAERRELDLGVVEIEQDDSLLVIASPTDLQILLTNLLGNALQYTPPNGRIDLSATRQGASVVLVISDSGPGIPPTERQRVFDPFYRILGQTASGSGLGLAIVKTITDRRKGSIKLTETDSQTGRGLKVSIRLPAVDR